MKLRNLSVALLMFIGMIGYSNTSLAEECYTVTGTVDTINVTSTLQVGTIHLVLTDTYGTVVFDETGQLTGNITGTDGIGTTLLSHRAQFPKGNIFVTRNDEAVLVSPFVRDTLPDGTPCSFWIHETITTIEKGVKFFRNVTSVEIFADGYTSNCPDENKNHFELSGQLCIE